MADATTAATARRRFPPLRTVPRPHVEIGRSTLPNGLRVVVAPDRGIGVVCVAVHYDVGFRSEPQGRTGFAHLFEHLMFQGSESLPKLEHFRIVQSSGGVFNGSTHLDYTDYYQVLPAAAVERGLFLEADRMRAPMITAENLANQVDVVSEEIRLNVLNRPYGGFPWLLLPPVLFDSFPNAHNGYGDFVDLQAATVDDCADFFEKYYTPANAVLTICGDVDPDLALDLASSHFADVPRRPRPQRPSFAEPALTVTRRAVHHDPAAPAPALALGWQLPDPVGRLKDYLAFVLLAGILSDGEASRLQTSIVTPGLATEVWANAGLVGGPLDARDPDVFVIGAIHTTEVTADALVDLMRREVGELAATGPTERELRAAVIRFCAGLYRENDSVGARARAIGALELLHGRAELISELPAVLDTIGIDDVAAAARALDFGRSAMLEVTGHGAQQRGKR